MSQTKITPHQFLIHLVLEFGSRDLLVVYSYPFSQPHELRERTIRVVESEIPKRVKTTLDSLVRALIGRIPAPNAVRMPHAEIEPQIRYTGATVVVQDKRRDDLPLAVMYYLEVVPGLCSQVQRQVRIERDDFSDDELAAWNGLRQAVKSIVWAEYKKRFGSYFRE
jgi:hypothetical protein